MNWRREPKVRLHSLPHERKVLAERYTIDAEEAERRAQSAEEQARQAEEAASGAPLSKELLAGLQIKGLDGWPKKLPCRRQRLLRRRATLPRRSLRRAHGSSRRLLQPSPRLRHTRIRPRRPPTSRSTAGSAPASPQRDAQVAALPRASSFDSNARRRSSPPMSPVRRGIRCGSIRATLTISPLRSP